MADAPVLPPPADPLAQPVAAESHRPLNVRLRDRLIVAGLGMAGLATVAWWTAIAYGLWVAIC